MSAAGLIRELTTVDEYLESLGGHGQDPDYIAYRVIAFDRAALRAYISACSEEYDCSGWGAGFAERLWHAMGDDEQRLVPAKRIPVLRELSRRAGGWWHTPNWKSAPVFVSVAEWESVARR